MNVSLKIRKTTIRNLWILLAITVIKWLIFAAIGVGEHDAILLLLLEINCAIYTWVIIRTAAGESSIYSPLFVISIVSMMVFYVKPLYIIFMQPDMYALMTPGALAYLALFHVLFFSAYALGIHWIRAGHPEVNVGEEKIMLWALGIAWFVGLCYLPVLISMRGGVYAFLFDRSYLDRTLTTTTGGYGEHLGDMLLQSWFFIPVAVLAISKGLDLHRWFRRTVIGLCIVLIPLSLLVLENRRNMLGLVFGMALILMPRPKKKVVYGLLAFMFIAPFILTYYAAIRSLKVSEMNMDILQRRANTVTSIIFDSTEVGMVDEYLRVYADVGERLPIRWGAEYYKVFLMFIPREVMPTKPEASGTEYLKYYYRSWYFKTGGAVTISIPGELLWNLGPFGIIGAIPYGLFFAFIDRRLMHGNNLRARALYSITAFALMFGFVRGGHHLVLLEFLSNALPIWFGCFLIYGLRLINAGQRLRFEEGV